LDIKAQSHPTTHHSRLALLSFCKAGLPAVSWVIEVTCVHPQAAEFETPYRPDFSDSILILEAVDQAPQACDHLITQLKQIGVFEQIKGIVVGYIAGLQDREDAAIQMEDILLRLTSEYDFPILKINEFGHCCPNTVLPIGVKVSIDADQQEFEILESCVWRGQ
jgi:muramoyltetrapeptide carboxypeptidase LdcA involved in peptidoglycan recycling